MPKATVLDVGNCDPDHAVIRRMLTERFDVTVDRVMFVDEAIEHMRASRYALVLFNRVIFADGSPGLAILEKAGADPELASIPIMMVSNFAEAQAQCIAAGGVAGFGKNSIFEEETSELLRNYLPKKE